MDTVDFLRLLTVLMMPLSVSLVAGLVALACLGLGRARAAAQSLCVSVACVGIFSLPVVASGLMGSLEGQHPPKEAGSCAKAEAIVVLGGAVRPRLQADPFVRLHQGSDRVAVAAALYRAGCAPVIFIAAGGKNEPPVIQAEAFAIRDLLLLWGVPAQALLLDANSRNTAQNAGEAWKVLSQRGGRKILLVTSAWHLPRAVAEFESMGFEVAPVGADYRGFATSEVALMKWLPDPKALLESHLALKEHLGALVQRWR